MYDFKSKPLHITDEFSAETEPPRKWPWIAALALFVAAIGGGGWYVYSTLNRVPSPPTQLASLSPRLDAADAKMQFWTGRQQELENQVANLQKRIESRYQAARKQARELSEQVYGRVRQEIADQMQAVETRLARVESTSDAHQARFDKMQADLAALRDQTARQAAELHSAQEQIERAAASRDQQLVSLNQQLSNQATEVNGLARKLESKRVDFEVTRNHSQDLAAGVSLDVTSTDVRYRRVSGWIWLMPDRRTIWLHDQGAQEPVVFYTYPDGKRRELVITNVTQDSASGYLLLPEESGQGLNAALTPVDSHFDR
jgi:chaperonin cofactor prefoldin